jgi:hypothetical protein
MIILVLLATEVEVYTAIMQMERNKSPEPDDFPGEFYQACWDFIKFDITAMFASFHYGELHFYHLNFGSIVLLLKKQNNVQIQQYCPICLLNESFKIFTKVGTSRLTIVAPKIIGPTQTAFMRGRHILEGWQLFMKPFTRFIGKSYMVSYLK